MISDAVMIGIKLSVGIVSTAILLCFLTNPCIILLIHFAKSIWYLFRLKNKTLDCNIETYWTRTDAYRAFALTAICMILPFTVYYFTTKQTSVFFAILWFAEDVGLYWIGAVLLVDFIASFWLGGRKITATIAVDSELLSFFERQDTDLKISGED